MDPLLAHKWSHTLQKEWKLIICLQELLHQGEQLDNIEAKTAAINADMKTSQRHLNSIKSVFGGIKNWWSGGKKQEAEQASTTTTNQRQSRLRDTMDSRRENETEHPAMRLHSEDVSGFYETDSDYPQQKQVSSGMKAYDEQFNKNLGAYKLFVYTQMLRFLHLKQLFQLAFSKINWNQCRNYFFRYDVWWNVQVERFSPWLGRWNRGSKRSDR